MAEGGPGGLGLQVNGAAVFSKSGLLTIAAGSSSGTVTGIVLSAASLVLATVQQDLPGVWVRSAVPDAAGDSLTINLTTTVPVATSVGWFVVN